MATNNTVAAGVEPQYIPTSEEMVIDTQDYDIFSSLDDLVVEDASAQEKVTPKDDVAQTNLEDEATEEENDSDDNGFDFEDIDDDDLPEDQRKEKKTDGEDSEDEDEEEFEEDEEEEDEESDEETENEEEEFEDESEEEVDYETYEITLPNGDNVTLQEAIEGYRAHEVILQEKEDFNVAKEAFKAEAGNTLKYLKLAQLEADRVIDDYTDFDWGELSQKDPQAYVENREFLDKYRARKGEIMSAMEEIENQEAEAKLEAFQQSARTCLSDLKAEIPGWNDALYQDLMQYAIDSGSSEEDIANCVDPAIFKMLHKARQFDIGKQVVKAKIKRKVGSPKKVVRSNAKSTKAPISNKDKIASKLAQGITEDSDVFDALED